MAESIRISGFGFPDSGFTFRASGFRFQVLGCRLRVSGLGFMVSGFWFWVASFWFLVSGFGFRVSVFGFQVSGFWFRVSGFGFQASGFGFTAEVAKSRRASFLASSPGVLRPLRHFSMLCAEEGRCEDRIGTGPPRARTEVIYADLRYWAFSRYSANKERAQGRCPAQRGQLETFCLKAKSRIWSWLSYMCHIRSIEVHVEVGVFREIGAGSPACSCSEVILSTSRYSAQKRGGRA